MDQATQLGGKLKKLRVFKDKLSSHTFLSQQSKVSLIAKRDAGELRWLLVSLMSWGSPHGHYRYIYFHGVIWGEKHGHGESSLIIPHSQSLCHPGSLFFWFFSWQSLTWPDRTYKSHHKHIWCLAWSGKWPAFVLANDWPHSVKMNGSNEWQYLKEQKFVRPKQKILLFLIAVCTVSKGPIFLAFWLETIKTPPPKKK